MALSKTLVKEKPETTAAAPAALCSNCAHALAEADAYCPSCGARRPERITVARLFAEARHKVLSLDFKLLRTLRDLVRRPGTAIREYIAGQREGLSNPIWFAFLTTTAFIAANNFLARGMSRIFNPLVNARGLWPYLFFVAILPGVGVQRLLFRKSKLNFAETYAFATLICGQLVLVEAAYLPLATIGWPWGRLLLTLLEAFYFAWAIAQLNDSRKPSVWLRGIIAFVGYAGTAVGALWLMIRQITQLLI
jgi:uncharacterized protein DUF3667